MKKHLAIVILLLSFLLIAMSFPANAADPIQVVVSIRPQIYVVQQLGGDLVNVTSMLPEGAFPGVYEPTSQQMQDLSTADMYVRIKVPYEIAWWEKMAAANPKMHMVDATTGVDFIEAGAHQHEDAGEKQEQPHEQHGRDPHIWLSPRLVKIQAENIYRGLIAVDPANKDAYTANKEAFLKTLDRLDVEIQGQLAHLKTRKFMIFHPAWTYFARDYNVEQVPVEIEGKEPSAKEMAALMKIAQAEHITTIFVQPQTSRRSADVIAQQIGIQVVILDPLAANWLDNMRHVTRVLAEALTQ